MIGNGCGVRKNLGKVRGFSNASTPDVREGRDITELDYDANNEEVGGLGQNDSPPMRSLEFLELPQNEFQRKRSRIEHDGSSNLGGNALKSGILEPLTRLTRTFERFYDFMRKRENERICTTWDGIKEVPNLDVNARFNAFNLLDTETKKDGFLSMTPEERKQWITNKTRE